MIKSFRIQNFKILRDICIEPAPVNVIIGPNGCGKTSLLQALDFLRAFFMSSIEVYLQARGWNYKDIPNIRGTSRTIQWELVAELGADPGGRGAGRYEYSISVSPRRYLGIGREELSYTPQNGKTIPLLKRVGRNVDIHSPSNGETRRFLVPNLPASAMWAFGGGRDRDRYPEMRNFAFWVSRIRYFSILNPETLRTRDRGKYLFLGQSGEHLAPILANFKKRRPAEFQSLLSRLRTFFPNLADISFSGEGWGWRSLRTHERLGPSEVVFNNRQISDGLLRLLALASFLYLDTSPTVFMFEEPENGVHPHILREMVQVLRELTLRKFPTKAQVFFTTHSPYVLDEFYDHPEQVWVMDAVTAKSGARIARLSDQSQLEKLKKTFGSLGEAWFSNVIGGTPPTRAF